MKNEVGKLNGKVSRDKKIVTYLKNLPTIPRTKQRPNISHRG